MIKELSLRTSSRVELVDITDLVQEAVSKSGMKSGLCCVYVPHTTAGVTINENADPSVRKDIIKELNKAIPFEDNYFDVVYSGGCVHHMVTSFALPEIARVLCSGGKSTVLITPCFPKKEAKNRFKRNILFVEITLISSVQVFYKRVFRKYYVSMLFECCGSR